MKLPLEPSNLAHAELVAKATHQLTQPIHALNLHVEALMELDTPKPLRAHIMKISGIAAVINYVLGSLLVTLNGEDKMNYPANIPENYPANIPENYPANIPENYPANIPENYPANIPENYPANIPANCPANIPDISAVPSAEPVSQKCCEPPLRDVAPELMIAVIDDNRIVLDAIGPALEGWNYQVITATSGRQARARLKKSKRAPDIILCDFLLAKGECGIATIASLRKLFNREIPALLISGVTEAKHYEMIRVSGLKLIRKSAACDHLRTALVQVLNHDQ